MERRCDCLKRLTFSLLSAAQNHVKEGDPGRRPLSDILCAGKYLLLDDADRNLRRSRINLQREKL